jgi:hypothetical protein
MRAKGMINTFAIDFARRQLATAGANLVAGMSPFLPALWPPHRYDSVVSPNGAFIESTVDRSAPNHPPCEVRVPEWTPNGAPYDFAEAEGVKLTDLRAYLFTRRDPAWLANYFAFEPDENVFVPFGRRGDRAFESGKFPRDIWKAGSFDVDAWRAGRNAIGSAASYIMYEIDRVNDENHVLMPRNWIITKFVQGPLVAPCDGQDVTFANMPEILEDVAGGWEQHAAYVRVGSLVSESDATWTAAGLSLAAASQIYDLLFLRLSGAGFSQDFFDSCFTLWRTGSQTRRRDSYE